MNRIILIGNGFDRAHGLATTYKDFIDDFWRKEIEIIKGQVNYRIINNHKSEFIRISISDGDLNHAFEGREVECFNDLLNMITHLNENWKGELISFEIFNTFLEYITKRSNLENWVDIEDAYHTFLVKTARNEKVTYNGKEYRYVSVKDLNNDFKAIEVALGEYLERLIETQKENQNILSELDLIFDSAFVASDFSSKGVKALNRGMNPIVRVNNTLFLNFNYTKLETSYVNKKNEVVHIHGELGQAEKPAIERNPMIFGYGDELCDEYKELERMNDNTFLENIKSIKYLETNNYKKLLSFIDSEEYQVFVMGHSCGNSDRTLLNTLFEHENCVSIKVFYHGYSDKNNYSDIVRNISRNFDDKKSFREKVVNERDCQRMPQYDKK